MPSPGHDALLMDKENMTLDTSVIAAKATSKLQKRSRSKSLGPGGIDALKEDTGNRRKVGDIDIDEHLAQVCFHANMLMC